MTAFIYLVALSIPQSDQSANQMPAVLREVRFDQRLGEAVPLDARFRDHTGKVVHLGDYFGRRPVVLVLVQYRCPMLCNLVLEGLADSLQRLSLSVGREFDVVTVSFDGRETPPLAAAKRQAYLEAYGRPEADAGWHFLTGDPAEIDRLAQAVGFRFTYDPRLDQFAHAAGIVLATAEGTVTRYFFGVQFPPADLRLGLVETSAGRIGTPIDRVLLFCYGYDPVSGRYNLLILRLIRLGAVLTLLALGGFIGLSLRREWRQRRAAPHSAEVPA